MEALFKLNLTKSFGVQGTHKSSGYSRKIFKLLICFRSERELIDEEEDLYDSVPEAEDGIYGSVIDIKQPSGPQPKVCWYQICLQNALMWYVICQSSFYIRRGQKIYFLSFLVGI